MVGEGGSVINVSGDRLSSWVFLLLFYFLTKNIVMKYTNVRFSLVIRQIALQILSKTQALPLLFGAI